MFNAVKFTNSGQVVFRVFTLSHLEKNIDKKQFEQYTIRFEVKDTGIGIPSDKLEKIFSPFEQVMEMPIREGAAGLGLSVSRQLSHLLGGEIKVESEFGHGSTFWFDLTTPVVESLILKKTIERIVTGYKGSRKKVLIVDDRSTNRSVLVDWLEPLGFEVAVAENGIQAIASAKKMNPDLIMMDLVMPEMEWFRSNSEDSQNSRVC